METHLFDSVYVCHLGQGGYVFSPVCVALSVCQQDYGKNAGQVFMKFGGIKFWERIRITGRKRKWRNGVDDDDNKAANRRN